MFHIRDQRTATLRRRGKPSIINDLNDHNDQNHLNEQDEEKKERQTKQP